MLKEQISEGRGKVTGRRVIDGPRGHRVETSFEEQVKMLGVDGRGMGTYWAEVRQDGSLFGEGQGVWMGAAGEAVQWRGQGIGIFQPDGGIKFRGAIYYTTTAERLLRLNRIAGVFEHDVSADGTSTSKIWEWT